MEITSAALQNGQRIPQQFTRDSRDVSPPLQWDDPPAGTQSFALICEDPDAPRGTFTHWVLFNLPGDARSLPEGVPQELNLPSGAVQGKNGFGKIGYNGPAPPPGKSHRYFFKLYALDRMLDLEGGASRDEVLTAVRGHLVAEAQVMGTYAR